MENTIGMFYTKISITQLNNSTGDNPVKIINWYIHSVTTNV